MHVPAGLGLESAVLKALRALRGAPCALIPAPAPAGAKRGFSAVFTGLLFS